MELSQTFSWNGQSIRWEQLGSGPSVVMCHGTPWSSWLWADAARALSHNFTVYLWDMPGYGQSEKADDQDVSLGAQGEALASLTAHLALDRPHVVGHDFGGAVALRAHLLHGVEYSSLALVDPVALSPWGSEFFNLVAANPSVFWSIPPYLHEAMVRSYVNSASHTGLRRSEEENLIRPWLGDQGQPAFYRQMAQADERWTDEIEPLYPTMSLPVRLLWGEDDTWIPIERGHRLAEQIPGCEFTTVPEAGHLVQLDAPGVLTALLQEWLLRVSGKGIPTEARNFA